MKKKGLIISTVVMVVVLIASLTTATYAWFSNTAQVTVDNLSITTVSTEGLQIALKNTNGTYASGSDLIYTDGSWQGSSDTWGSSLEFRDFVQGGDNNEGVVEFAGMEDAVTRVTNANTAYLVDKSAENNTFTYSTYKGVTLYSNEECTTAVWTANGEESDWNTAVAEGGAIAAVTGSLYAKYPVNTFLVPTGYDVAIQPTGYRPAQANIDYAVLPIVVRATSADVMQIFYQITVTPTLATIQQDYQPGMAAASRIIINEQADTETYKANVKPYDDAKMTETMIVDKVSNEKYGDKGAYTYTGFIYNGYTAPTDGSGTATKVAAGTGEKVFYLLIWIEGTDTECTNTTAGSGMTINIAIDYTKLDNQNPVTADRMGAGTKLEDLGGSYQRP